jgi:hypothetical protein
VIVPVLRSTATFIAAVTTLTLSLELSTDHSDLGHAHLITAGFGLFGNEAVGEYVNRIIEGVHT